MLANTIAGSRYRHWIDLCHNPGGLHHHQPQHIGSGIKPTTRPAAHWQRQESRLDFREPCTSHPAGQLKWRPRIFVWLLAFQVLSGPLRQGVIYSVQLLGCRSFCVQETGKITST